MAPWAWLLGVFIIALIGLIVEYLDDIRTRRCRNCPKPQSLDVLALLLYDAQFDKKLDSQDIIQKIKVYGKEFRRVSDDKADGCVGVD